MEIIIRNLQKKIPVRKTKIKKALLKLLSKEGPKLNAQIWVSFVTDTAIKALNAQFLNKNCATDVLAFDLSDTYATGYLVGDIVVSADTALRNARVFNTKPSYELNLYAVHGLLHLLGYGDHTRKEKQLMRRKEKIYVNQ
ncbi:MAG: rRNA maturation RNase YbeY [Candidatus Omnitrophota bacterium]